MTMRRVPPDPSAVHDLQVADARWSAVLGTVRDAIVAIDRQSRITLFNPAAEAVFGYSEHEVMGQSVTLLMPPPYGDEHDEYVRRYEATGEAHAIGRIRTVQGRRKDGTVFPLELSVSESRLGDEVLYTAILRDISERRAFEAALRVERDFAERLIEAAPMIVLVLDRGHHIVRFNACLEELSERRLADVRGRNWLETFIAERDHAVMRALCASAATTAPLKSHVVGLVDAAGGERLIAWTCKVLSTASGEPDGLLCIGEDVTNQLAAERELRELQRAAQERARLADIGAITAKIVHDLGNPLAALSMQAQLILRRARRGDFQPVAPVEGPAEQILRTLRRLEGLIREFNDFARDQRLDLRSIALQPFLNSCVELWQALASERGIALTLAPRGPLPVLRADDVLLRRVLDNLIKNAIEAVQGEPGEVIVSIAPGPNEGRICIVVEDNGAGIPDGLDVFRLFETTKADGTGIGLAVAKQLIAAHGGTIAHAARSPRGTRFSIELPLDGPTKESDDGLAAR
ncbi:MAG: PAS domain S-box protein [bacterium]